MTQYRQKLKGVAIGLCLAGMTAAASTSIPGLQGRCAGTCAQCGSCGIAALPLFVWLLSKRRKPGVSPVRDQQIPKK